MSHVCWSVDSTGTKLVRTKYKKPRDFPGRDVIDSRTRARLVFLLREVPSLRQVQGGTVIPSASKDGLTRG